MARIVGRINSITRLRNSASGNPRFEFVIDGDSGERTLRTNADSQVGYEFSDDVLSSTAVFILNKDGEVTSVVW